MDTLDFIIVGQGIAGSCLAFELAERGAKIRVIDDSWRDAACLVAAGVINPITGQRLVKRLAQRTRASVRKEVLLRTRKKARAHFLPRQKNTPTVQVSGRARALARTRRGAQIRRIYRRVARRRFLRLPQRFKRFVFYRAFGMGRDAAGNGGVQRLFYFPRRIAMRKIRLRKTRCKRRFAVVRQY